MFDRIEAWLARHSLPTGIAVIFLCSVLGTALIGIVGKAVMWGVYLLGWEDITPDEYMQKLMKEQPRTELPPGPNDSSATLP